MRYFSDVTAAAKLCFIAVGAAALLSCANASAQETGSRVEVLICPVTSQSRLMVTEPESDSVVNVPKIAIKGEVDYISQIDFFVDDTYNNTVALGYSATTFESPLTLSAGTHTIKLVAYDSCSQTTLSEMIVVTFEPATQPSVGSETPTDVPVPEMPEVVGAPLRGTGVAPGVVKPDITLPEKLSNQPVIGPLIQAVHNLDTDGATVSKIWDTSWRTLLVTVGTALVFVPSVFLPAWLSVEQLVLVGNAQPRMSRRTWLHGHILTKLVGVTLLIIPFIL